MKVRKAKRNEIELVLKELSKFRNVKEIFSGKFLLVEENKWKEFFLAGKKILKICNIFKDVHFAGFFIGETKRNKFKISLELAYEISKLTNDRKVTINEKASQLFLYRRDILNNSIVDFDEKIRKGDIVIVCNEEGDCLGIGRAVIDGREFGKGKKLAIRNIIDRGWYLRKGG